MTTFCAQLDGSPFAGENCGPASVGSALRWSTAHEVWPKPGEVRKKMGDFSGGTHPSDLRKGWEGFREQATKKGMTLAKMVYHDAEPATDLIDAISAGAAAVVAVSYAQVPVPLRGDPAFSGLHAVFVSKVSGTGENRRVKVWDPLCDGRRAGIPGPGPVWWPINVFRRALAGYAGTGKATWNQVAKSKKTAAPNPCEDEVADLSVELDRTQEALSVALDALRAIGDRSAQTIDDVRVILSGSTTGTYATAGSGEGVLK